MSQRSPRVPDLLAERAAAVPQGVALIGDTGPPLTFGGWQRRAEAFAGGLADRGAGPGDRVALLFAGTHWTDYAVAYFGTLLAGAVAVPLSPRLTSVEVGAAVRAAGCAGVVAAGDVAAVPAGAGWCAGPDLAGSGTATATAAPAGGGDLAEILHSSGTTGAPKLVGASHQNVLAGWTPGTSARHDPAQFFVHATPIATNSGQVTLLHPLLDPHTCVVMGRFEAQRYCDLIVSHRASHTLLVPAMARWLIDSGAAAGQDLSCVKTVVLTSAAASPDLLAGVAALFPAATVTNCYTSTEAWPAMTAMDYDPARPTALGRPPAGQQIRVFAPDGTPAPAGTTGEIALRAPGVAARSYLAEGPVAGPVGGVADGWVRTGDLGHLDQDGFLHLVGRRSEMMNSGGFLVAPAEVETTLEAHPAVAEAAVAGVAHPVLGEVVAAAVVTRSPVTTTELSSWLRDRLAEPKRPARIVLVDQLPRNALEKVDRPRLRQLLAATSAASGAAGGPAGDLAGAPAGGAGSAPARTPDEEILLGLWRDVLGRHDIEVHGIGVHDDFIAVGGHSLAAFEIAARAGQALGIDIPRELILAVPTVAGQAEAVRRLRRAGRAAHPAPSPSAVPITRRRSGGHSVR